MKKQSKSLLLSAALSSLVSIGVVYAYDQHLAKEHAQLIQQKNESFEEGKRIKEKRDLEFKRESYPVELGWMIHNVKDMPATKERDDFAKQVNTALDDNAITDKEFNDIEYNYKRLRIINKIRHTRELASQYVPNN